VVWPTYDTYCDLGLAAYCAYHRVYDWAAIITLPVLASFFTALAAYCRKNIQEEGIAVFLLVWPQVSNRK
jgi:hypothetical protein